MTTAKYDMSFSAGGLFYNESIKIVEIFNALGDWKAVQEKALSENVLQSRKDATSARFLREIIKRLKGLTNEQLSLFLEGNIQEQKMTLWLAVCKCHLFIKEFAIEVVREKFLRLNTELSYNDFDVFYNHKAEWDDDLARLSKSTLAKLRQVLFRMMEEAQIINSSRLIYQIIPTERIINIIKNDPQATFAIYPVYEADLKEWMK